VKKRIFTILLALGLLLALTTTPVAAATSQNVTVTAAPSYIDIANSPSTWTLNGITGSGNIAVNTVYYANPLGDTTSPSATVADGECRFTVTNTSSIAIDLTVNSGDFSGGDANMTNSDTGANGATSYGGYSWASGSTYSAKVVMKTTASAVMKDALAASTNIKWGAEMETQTNAWTGGTSSTCTMTITATAD
jgi:hypothetical protein